MKTTLLSFHGKQEIKNQKVNQLELHYQADEIIQGTYWQNGKGCAVGCTVHSSKHKAYETEMGIPMILARLEDKIFEGLPNNKAKEFPLRFIKAIPIGVDLSNVWRKFMIWLLIDEKEGVIQYAKTEKSKKAIQDISDAFSVSLTQVVPYEKWIKLRKDSAAYAAVDSAAADAAYAAVDAAESNKYIKMSQKLLQLLSEA